MLLDHDMFFVRVRSLETGGTLSALRQSYETSLEAAGKTVKKTKDKGFGAKGLQALLAQPRSITNYF
ncbi:MAG: hypothetical protein CMP41_03145 [Rickettsiales bacterium]|nr:hypothetical protein [Rickettsiales bacterium]